MSWHLELAFLMFVLLFITGHLHSATHSFEKYEQKDKCLKNVQLSTYQLCGRKGMKKSYSSDTSKEWWILPCPESLNLFVQIMLVVVWAISNNSLTKWSKTRWGATSLSAVGSLWIAASSQSHADHWCLQWDGHKCIDFGSSWKTWATGQLSLPPLSFLCSLPAWVDWNGRSFPPIMDPPPWCSG